MSSASMALACALRPRMGRQHHLLMLRAYFDESGRSDDLKCRYMGMGGLVATAEGWERFEPAWQAVLTEYGLPYFHMVDYVQYRGAFKEKSEWPEARRRALMAELLKAISFAQ